MSRQSLRTLTTIVVDYGLRQSFTPMMTAESCYYIMMCVCYLTFRDYGGENLVGYKKDVLVL